MKCDYVIPSKIKKWEKSVKVNTDPYGKSVVNSARVIMEKLKEGLSCSESWEKGIRGKGHSGMSAAYTAVTVANLSPRGNEFKAWCKNNAVVDVKWT